MKVIESYAVKAGDFIHSWASYGPYADRTVNGGWQVLEAGTRAYVLHDDGRDEWVFSGKLGPYCTRTVYWKDGRVEYSSGA